MWAYVDETGDRGAVAGSSPIFGMAAVLVTDAGAVDLRKAVVQLRADFGVPAGKVLSWKDHVKTHDRRRRASEVLSKVTELKVCYVYAIKSELDPASYVSDVPRFYNYVAFTMYKSISWAARNWQGPNAQLWTRFGHVRGHDHTVTDAYIRSEVARDSRIPFHMEQGLRWVSADQYLESQAADLFGGFLKAATWPDGAFGYTEPSYLQRVWHKIRNSEGCAIPLGIMSMPRNDLVCAIPGFPCGACPKKPGT